MTGGATNITHFSEHSFISLRPDDDGVFHDTRETTTNSVAGTTTKVVEGCSVAAQSRAGEIKNNIGGMPYRPFGQIGHFLQKSFFSISCGSK